MSYQAVLELAKAGGTGSYGKGGSMKPWYERLMELLVESDISPWDFATVRKAVETVRREEYDESE